MVEWLIEARKKKGYTQAEVARRVKISQPSYNAIEAGKSSPKPETAIRIGKELDLPWVKFYEEDNDDDEKAVP